MRSVFVAAGLVASLAATVAVAQQGQRQAFDLVCSGTEKPFGDGEPKPDTRRYTLDLSAKRWCRTSECREALPIQLVTADEITLTRSERGDLVEHRHFISRISGEYVETVALSSSGSRTTGTCSRAPFSGFPKAKF